MDGGHGVKEAGEPRVLLFSQRNIFSNYHYRIGLHEGEDVICEIDSVDLLAPAPGKWFKYGTRIANRLAADCAFGMNPGIPKVRIRKDYDLFFAVCQFPKDLLHVESIEGWKERSRTSICWLNEIWISEIYKYRYFLKILSKFDYVILTQSGSVGAVQREVDGKCRFLPLGIDSILFCPYPRLPRRVIDVYSIGRRAERTHQALLRMGREKGIFYVFDSINGCLVHVACEHRRLFVETAQRSRYFLVNPGKINSPDEVQGQREFGNRFFEGAASGTVMIGEHPHNGEFGKYFDWPDVVIHLPYGSDDIDAVISELDKQPERLEEIRRNNVMGSLMKHDWLYRWEVLMGMAGLSPLPAFHERKRRLEILMGVVDGIGADAGISGTGGGE